MGKSPLSPSHRRLLPELLSDKQEKEIAAAMGLSRATTHKHVTDLFRSFNVSNRAGLITLWMPEPGTAALLLLGAGAFLLRRRARS